MLGSSVTLMAWIAVCQPVGSMWGMALWGVAWFVALFLLTVQFGIDANREARFIDTGYADLVRFTHCPYCDYDLAGLTADICPECGEDITDQREVAD